MSTPINDGGPAFPVMYCSGGMTLRDWFAGQAMAAMVAPHSSDERIAAWSYQTADAMLAERAKEATK